MGWTILYIAFGVVALWLLGEVLLQYKARLRWRLLAFCGFSCVVIGVVMYPSVPLIGVGTAAFAVGQTFVTLSFRRGFSTGWALSGVPGLRRRRPPEEDDAGAPEPADAPPVLEVSGLTDAPPSPEAPPPPPAEAPPPAAQAPRPEVYQPEPLPDDTAGYAAYGTSMAADTGFPFGPAGYDGGYPAAGETVGGEVFDGVTHGGGYGGWGDGGWDADQQGGYAASQQYGDAFPSGPEGPYHGGGYASDPYGSGERYGEDPLTGDRYPGADVTRQAAAYDAYYDTYTADQHGSVQGEPDQHQYAGAAGSPLDDLPGAGRPTDGYPVGGYDVGGYPTDGYGQVGYDAGGLGEGGYPTGGYGEAGGYAPESYPAGAYDGAYPVGGYAPGDGYDPGGYPADPYAAPQPYPGAPEDTPPGGVWVPQQRAGGVPPDAYPPPPGYPGQDGYASDGYDATGYGVTAQGDADGYYDGRY